MLIASGSLLLLACALVQVLLTASKRRAAFAAMLAAAAAHLAFAVSGAAHPWEAIGALVAFAVACAAIHAGHGSATARLAALAALCDVDEATGCLNRRGFSSRLDAVSSDAMRSGAPVALLALDLDHFKRVNDQFGHLTGDAVLGEVSAALREAVAHRGVVARLGGEEFAVLLPDTDAEGAGVMAEEVLVVLRALRLQSLPASVRVTMSIGIASERILDAGTSDALRARADEALYAGKRHGRDRALLWAPGVHSHATPVRSMAAIGRSGSIAPRAARCQPGLSG